MQLLPANTYDQFKRFGFTMHFVGVFYEQLNASYKLILCICININKPIQNIRIN